MNPIITTNKRDTNIRLVAALLFSVAAILSLCYFLSWRKEYGEAMFPYSGMSGLSFETNLLLLVDWGFPGWAVLGLAVAVALFLNRRRVLFYGVAANAVVSLVLFFLSPPSVLGHYVGAARTATENIFEHLLRLSIWLLLIPMILRGGKKSGIFGIASACLSVVYVVLVFVRYGLYPRAWCGNMSLEIAVRICYCFAITLLLFLFSYSLPNYKAIAAVKKIETNQNYDITDKLLHLKELRDKGILTEEEYEDKKKQLLET